MSRAINISFLNIIVHRYAHNVYQLSFIKCYNAKETFAFQVRKLILLVRYDENEPLI